MIPIPPLSFASSKTDASQTWFQPSNTVSFGGSGSGSLLSGNVLTYLIIGVAAFVVFKLLK